MKYYQITERAENDMLVGVVAYNGATGFDHEKIRQAISEHLAEDIKVNVIIEGDNFDTYVIEVFRENGEPDGFDMVRNHLYL